MDNALITGLFCRFSRIFAVRVRNILLLVLTLVCVLGVATAGLATESVTPPTVSPASPSWNTTVTTATTITISAVATGFTESSIRILRSVSECGKREHAGDDSEL